MPRISLHNGQASGTTCPLRLVSAWNCISLALHSMYLPTKFFVGGDGLPSQRNTRHILSHNAEIPGCRTGATIRDR
jgi:hypothetical protein